MTNPVADVLRRAGQWIIYSRKARLWWSNDLGWADRSSATRFTTAQRSRLYYMALPDDGRWVRLRAAADAAEGKA